MLWDSYSPGTANCLLCTQGCTQGTTHVPCMSCCPPATELPGQEVWRDPSISHARCAGDVAPACAWSHCCRARHMLNCLKMPFNVDYFKMLLFYFQKIPVISPWGSCSHCKFKEKKYYRDMLFWKQLESGANRHFTENHFPEKALGNTITTSTTKNLTVTTLQNRLELPWSFTTVLRNRNRKN